LLGWPQLDSELEGAKRAYIIADEFLYELPFSTLTQSSGSKTQFLAERVSVLSAASAFLASKQPPAAAPKTQRILISADPNFQGSRDLVEYAKRHFPQAEELMIEKPNFQKVDVLEKVCQRYDACLFFGHAVADPVYPEESYIEIWVRNATQASTRLYRLSMQDLRSSRWPGAGLVLLIGCETAGSKVYRGSGIAGLQQSFLNLGTGSVLATLWRIDSAQAAAQIRSFLEAWQHFSDPIEAYNALQRKSIQELAQSSYYRNPLPYLWGGYNLAMTNPTQEAQY
jgi:CHAT domain-containing protein